MPYPTPPKKPAEGPLIDRLCAQPEQPLAAAFCYETAVRAARAKQQAFPEQPLSGATLPEALCDIEPESPLGVALGALVNGAHSDLELESLSALTALGMGKDFPSAPEAELETMAQLVWLFANTSLNVFQYAESALQDDDSAFFEALAGLCNTRPADPNVISREGALVALQLLARSDTEAARTALARVTGEAPASRIAWLAEATKDSSSELEGELSRPPYGPVVTFFLGISFYLLLERLLGLLLRYALGFKRSASFALRRDRIDVSYKLELLGKVIREGRRSLPLSEVSDVVREVRFARLGLYAGLMALVIGTYVGVGALVDGVRVPGGSSSLIGIGLLFILVGVALDFVLSSLADSLRGKCRLIVTPKKGRRLCLSGIDKDEADSVLASALSRAQSQSRVAAAPEAQRPAHSFGPEEA